MDSATARKQLHSIVDGTILRGEFKLASGRSSRFYINGKLFTLRSDGAFLVARLMVDVLREHGITAIVGAPRGADPMVGAILAVAHQQGHALKGMMVRQEAKDHGTKKLIEGPLPSVTDRVAIIEDTVTTGGSIIKAVDKVEAETPAKVCLALVVMDRQEGASDLLAKRGIIFKALFTKSDFGLTE